MTRFIHPLKAENSKNIPVNRYSGEKARSDVNVNNSLEIWVKEMIGFQDSLPDGFKTTLKTQIVTMTEPKKKSHYAEDPVVINYNTDLIMSKVLYLVGNQQVEFSTLFKYELPPVPTSMFQDLGDTRNSKTKLVLKNKLKIEVSVRGIQAKVISIEGRGMLQSLFTGLKMI